MILYRHLHATDRLLIYHLRKLGLTLTDIARRLGVHKSTISREISRNSGGRGYRPQQANRLALERRCVVHPRYDRACWDQVGQLLHFDLSPEQVHNRLEMEGIATPSHTAIYDWVDDDRRQGGTLHKKLRCNNQRRRAYGGTDRRGHMPDRESIDARPAEVEGRSVMGHWEEDLMIGKDHKGALVNMTERVSRFLCLTAVPTKEAARVSKAIIDRLGPHKDRVQTLTNDNGKEFADHKTIAKELEAKVYFCDPHAAWQRGTCENQNGLLRQYFPKHRRLNKVKQHELSRAEYRLNHRPRKCLGWKTPHEVFYNTSMSIFDVALRT